MDTKIRNNPSKYTLRTYNIGKQSWCLHLVKVQPETRPWSTGIGLSLLHTYEQGVLEWCLSGKIYLSEGPTRNRCHVTAIDIIGWMTPNLDPEVFCCKIWSKIVSYIHKHKIWPKYGILSQWWLHTKLKKASKGIFAVLSSSWRYPVWLFGLNHWMKAGFKPNNVVIPILTVHCLNNIFPETAVALKHQEYSHTFYRVTPNMCIIYRMRNDCLCWLFPVTVDIIREWLPHVTELPFYVGIHLGRCTAPSTVFSQPYGKKRSFDVLFMVSRVKACLEWTWCTETLITYHIYLFWHDQVWRHRLRHMGR